MRFWAAFLTLSVLGAPWGCAREPDRAETPLLDVAGKPVMLAEFDRFVELSVQQESPFLSEDLMAALLEQFIEEQLLLRAADDAGIQADPKRVSRMEASLDSPEALPAASVQMDEASLRASLERQARIETLVETEVLSNLSVEDQEVERYFAARQGDFIRAESVDVSQILVEDEALAKEIRAELKANPSSFEELARANSIGPEAEDGGHMGSFARGELPPSFEAEVFTLAPGRLSDVVSTDFGFHIFKVNAKQEEQVLELEDVADAIRVDLLRDKSDEAMTRYVEELRQRYPLTIFREHLSFAFVDWTDAAKLEVEQ